RKQPAVGPIENIEISIAIRLHDQVLVAAIDNDRDFGGIPIVLVVPGELEMPLELASVGIERKQGVAVEIVAGAALAAIGGRRISGWPENQVRRRIVDARDPRGSATGFV